MADGTGPEERLLRLEAELAAIRGRPPPPSQEAARAPLDRFNLPLEVDLETPYLRVRDFPETRFAAHLPQVGPASQGQVGLLLDSPLPTDQAYQAARTSAHEGTRFKGQIYRHIFSSGAYLTLAGDALTGYFDQLEGFIASARTLNEKLSEVPLPADPGADASEEDRNTYQVQTDSINFINTELPKLVESLEGFRQGHTSTYNTHVRSTDVLLRAVGVLFTDLAPSDALPKGTSGFLKDQFTQPLHHTALDPALASTVEAFQTSIDKAAAKEAARVAVGAGPPAGGGKGTAGAGKGSAADDKVLKAIEALNRKVAALEKGKSSAKGKPPPSGGGEPKG